MNISVRHKTRALLSSSGPPDNLFLFVYMMIHQEMCPCLQDWSMADHNSVLSILSSTLLRSVRQLYFENCSLETVEESDWGIACRRMTSLTRLHLEIGPALPEAITTIKSLRSLTIECDHDCSQVQWLANMTKLTQLIVGGRERIPCDVITSNKRTCCNMISKTH